MSKSTHLLWIAEAEARSLQDFTLLQHASSEPCVAIVSPAERPARPNCWRRLIARLSPTAARGETVATVREPAQHPGSAGLSGHAGPARPFQPVLVETSFDAQRT